MGQNPPTTKVHYFYYSSVTQEPGTVKRNILKLAQISRFLGIFCLREG